MALTSAKAAEAPRFRLLLHGRDGSVPYLTPELMRLVFCPDGGGGGGGSAEDWRWRRRHFILGVAVKDTCVTPLYREAAPPAKKRRKAGHGDDGKGGDRPTKRARWREHQSCPDRSGAEAKSSTAAPKTANDGGKDADDERKKEAIVASNAKKPAGYTFLDPSRSSQICAEIRSCAIDPKDDAAARGTEATTYMHAHLRIPRYISTVIVPAFSLDHSDNSGDCSKEGVRDDNEGSMDTNRDKKHVQKKQQTNQNPNRQMQQKQQQRPKGPVIPNSTKDSMPVDTPHGWQKLGPEQYWDAVLSLTTSVASAASSRDDDSIAPVVPARESKCEGAVGLFDHAGANRGARAAEQSLRRVAQRTADWSRRTRGRRERAQEMAAATSVDFWEPVHLAPSRPAPDPSPLPPGGSAEQGASSPCSKNIAIVGWDAVGHGREPRRKALRDLMDRMRSFPEPPMQYLALSVGDLQSILDAAGEGISVIGTDLVRRWSHDGKALCLDLTFGPDAKRDEEGDGAIVGGRMDLRGERHARDSSPILPGCGCLACRPSRTGTGSDSGGGDDTAVPSFTRAYIHHLIKAKEMLAETLLFVHNLHQMLLLFRGLSEAYSSGEGRGNGSAHGGGRENGGERNLAAFIRKVEEQLRV